MEGRFDLHEPEGTCYLASDEVSALLEVIGADREGGVVVPEFFGERRLREVKVPQDLDLSDFNSRKASRFGITAEIGTILPYDCPQAWAARLRQTGSPGVVYWLRHDPSRAEGFALFGPHGERKEWKRGRERRISGDLVERLRSETGLEFETIPRADQLRIIGD